MSTTQVLCTNGMIFSEETTRNWPRVLRGFLFSVGMIYFFLGVAIVADLFMAAIEKVTSRRRKILGPNGRTITVKVWNETVATLTLMALGSSAPEIFLSIIDIVKKSFHFGALGPSTIVGSAAFNLLVIVAVCIYVIPSDEVRIISNLPAFYITAFFSMVAYVWMAVILAVNTPQIVDVWEALVTFLLLPVLIFVSYKVDRGDANGILLKVGIITEDEEETTDTSAGFLAFSSESLKVTGTATETNLEIMVLRRGGKAGALVPLSCSFHTEPMSAAAGVDFEEAEGTLEMEEDQVEARIQIRIPERNRRLTDVEFLLVLEDAEGGPGFDPNDDGGEDSAIMTIMIEKYGSEGTALLRVFDRHVGLAHIQQGMLEWRDQIMNVIYCNGSPEEQAEASRSDWAMHLIALPWKLIFSTLPPVNLCGGWACFYGSLGGIAILTAAVSDLAELFGCALDIPAIVTAVTFVALGTSMPDLFASLSAAKDDPTTADASVVNVTGSNSVNVFLGLGVPWTIAAVHWMVAGRTTEWENMYPEVASRVSGSAFVVEAENLGFSVGAFCYVCVLALLLLYFRRKWVGAELGGPYAAKLSTSIALVSFWLLWVSIASWRVLRIDEASSTESVTILVAAFVVSIGGTVTPLIVMKRASSSMDTKEGSSEDGATTVNQAEATQADTGGTGHMMTEVDVDQIGVKDKTEQDGAKDSLEQAAECNDSAGKASAPCSVGTIEDNGGKLASTNAEEAPASWDDLGAEGVAEEKEREPPGATAFRNPSAMRS
eukprot:CAMPEP_0115746880 /NCGR_PEP_ID=MMETSP0272-20121206/92866_1 /TAXON_ID=71861 /ORGANISM="Scrippsiella trochoidea, Strain CCMP3099" /LENGTH=772 /DNA_ID=CAMNT_0003191837 /DNA_START=148 /DNA_END=2467 /DNA_ORIENTATION=+